IVSGGRQTRVGPLRMMADLARIVAESGCPVFRYDRRGAGDSSGADPGFQNSGPDIAAAAAAFRTACPNLTEIFGLGLCDGATALALHHADADLSGLILLNPWVVEAEPNAPPPAAIRAHYRDRLLTRKGWHKTLTNGFNPRALATGLLRALSPQDNI